MMKIAQFDAFGEPATVIACVDVEGPAAPGPDEAVIEIQASPINPADLLVMSGRYANRPELPSRLGAEGVGRVIAVGDDVESVSVGDVVLPLGRDNWVQRKKEKAASLIRLPPMDTLQAAMLKVNPATAWFLLQDYVDLNEGDLVVQNASNSGVGMNLVRLAESRGINTINIVRRRELIPLLKDEVGASEVVLDGPDLIEEITNAAGGRAIRLAIDAVGGDATRTLAKCVQSGGTVVNYGLLSGEPCSIEPHDLVFRGITLTGFWLAKLLSTESAESLRRVYGTLAALVADGTLVVPVEKTYSIDQIKQAVEHAGQPGRGGKILVLPNR